MLITGFHYWKTAIHLAAHHAAGGWWFEAYVLVRYQRGFLQ